MVYPTLLPTITAYAHTSAASSRLNWRPHLFKWTRPFHRKTKSGFWACAITSTSPDIFMAYTADKFITFYCSTLTLILCMLDHMLQGGSNVTGTDLCVNEPHCAAAVRPWESETTTSTIPPARVRTCSVLSGSC